MAKDGLGKKRIGRCAHTHARPGLGERKKGLMAMDHRCDDVSRFACALSPRSVWGNQVEALDDGR